MDHIERYDERFFDCRKSQILACLHKDNVDIVPFFFNTYQSTDRIYQQICVEGKTRWKYTDDSLSEQDLARKGITLVRVSFDRFQDASEYLKTLTARIKVAYLWGDEYYLPYRKEAYQNIHSVHSYMVTGYDGATKSYYVQDWDGLYGYLEESHIQNAYDHLPDRYRNIEHLEYRSDGLRYNFQEDFELFLGWLRSFKDEGQYYRYAVEGASTLERQKLTAMEHGFAIIASSRYVFSKFLQYVNCDKRLVTEVLECHRFAKLIQTIIRRYLLSSVVDQSDLVDKIVDLEKRERSFIRDLRERYLT